VNHSTNEPGSLVIRADASSQMGTGHVMRCLALAQAWQDAGGRVVFLMAASTSSTIEQRLVSEGVEVVRIASRPGSSDDASQTASFAEKLGARCVVVDGYHFGAGYQRIIKDSGQRLLWIDDCGHADHYYADFVLNQNLHAYERLYASRESYTQLLLGPRYSLLRREFLKWRGWRRRGIPRVARKLLVTLGGGDPDNMTLKVIQALQQAKIDGLETVVVVGGSNPHYEQLKSAIEDFRPSMRLKRDVTSISELMAWADVAVSSGGSTCWELMFMELPSLVVVLADNQCPIAEQLEKRGVVKNLGWHASLSPVDMVHELARLLTAEDTRAKMSRCGRQLVDGEGTERLLMRLNCQALRLRRAREEDCKLLWQWANDPEVRRVSFSSDPIAWECHVKWFHRKLDDPTSFIFIALDGEDAPIGQIRFDLQNEHEAEIDVSIDRDKRGSGYGRLLINTAIAEMFHVTPVGAVHAFIKRENRASIKAFVGSEFKKKDTENRRKNIALHYVRVKNQA
jgi:UDP-2,4-diacetamido-2,4,6-trideoxy-beta-L-altropyranose hydrolase